MPSEASSGVSPEDLFACKQCGDCCRGFGGTYLTPQDIQTIASFIGSSIDDFIKQYCAPSGSRRVLAQKTDGYCIFFEDLCTIHPVKPRMCRQWPFIQNVLIDPKNWDAMASACPGMKTGFSPRQVTDCIRSLLEADPGHGPGFLKTIK